MSARADLRRGAPARVMTPAGLYTTCAHARKLPLAPRVGYPVAANIFVGVYGSIAAGQLERASSRNCESLPCASGESLRRREFPYASEQTGAFHDVDVERATAVVSNDR